MGLQHYFPGDAKPYVFIVVSLYSFPIKNEFVQVYPFTSVLSKNSTSSSCDI